MTNENKSHMTEITADQLALYEAADAAHARCDEHYAGVSASRGRRRRRRHRKVLVTRA